MEIEEARNTTFEYSDNLQNSNDAVKEEPCSDYLYEEGSIKIEEHDLELDESIIKSVKIERDEDNKENEKSLTAFAQTLTKEHFKCEYITKQESSLKKHLLVHAGENSSKCGTSTKSDYASLQIVDSRSNLLVHKDEHFKCTKCDYRTTLRGDLTKHLLVHAREKSSKCGTSTKSDYASLQIVASRSNLSVHKDEHFKCTKCDYRTTLRGDLTKHLLIHAREKSFECGTSTKSDYASLQIIDSRGNLLVHKDEHFKCTKCDYRTTLRGDLRKHLLVHAREKSFKCGTSTKSDYASLKKVNSSNLLVYKDEHFKCTKCDYRTTMRDDLKKHLLVHFGEKTCKCGTGTTGPKSDYASLQKVYSRSNLFVYKVENFKCTECEYRTTLGGDLKKNLLVHTGEKSSKCGTSTKPDYASLHKVDSRSNLLVHKDEHFKCTKCDYRTTLRGDLKKHLLVHTGEKSSKSSTSTKSNYASLQKVYSSSTLLVDKDEHFKCTKCEYRTTLRGDLKKHLLEHVSEKSYKCSVCDYTSLQRTQLNVHLLTHISAQSFKCDICDYACFEKSMLKRHFLLVHIDENPFKCN